MNKEILELARDLYSCIDGRLEENACDLCQEDCLQFDANLNNEHCYPCFYIDVAKDLYKMGYQKNEK